MNERVLGPVRLRVVVADITTLEVDAIVNAANEGLAPGGGVCGAIHRAAGPRLAEECRGIGRCPTGDARITAGYGLPARHVIHAVGPVWRGGTAGEGELLAAAYRSSLALAAEHRLASIAFPAISTGIYGYPPAEAADRAVNAVAAFVRAGPGSLRDVVFCCFSEDSAAEHRRALERLG
ncbi:O-acetyl-ADP-ribose deacetylase [Propylenella binzhouense]|uniref:O-acetyl-ADP-ribose deacetylase n=1 Tax=Propylenella binzhouense TaxID=2555902 RepID=A0A964WU40_9HYPH|nr:O-acetyl-ADP-ribose deacetylase [Propylenella binzhouense]MYZ48651.1 O-acetyl-ADP-ribose deacetylase [Propylenella binzhouense]